MSVDSAAIALCDRWNVVVVTPVVSEPSSAVTLEMFIRVRGKDEPSLKSGHKAT